MTTVAIVVYLIKVTTQKLIWNSRTLAGLFQEIFQIFFFQGWKQHIFKRKTKHSILPNIYQTISNIRHHAIRSWQCHKLFIKYSLQLHAKNFILPRWDPSFALSGFCFAGMKFSHVITSACLSRMKKLINTPVWKYP